MFVDENPPLLPAARGRVIGEVVAPATNGLFRASDANPLSVGGGWSKSPAAAKPRRAVSWCCEFRAC